MCIFSWPEIMVEFRSFWNFECMEEYEVSEGETIPRPSLGSAAIRDKLLVRAIEGDRGLSWPPPVPWRQGAGYP